MAHMVESAIEQTFMAFEDQDYTMAEDVIKGDRTVNDMERAIESRCLSLILRQQPVAIDVYKRQVKTFWLIMLPMAQPGIVTVTIFNFINIWNEYFICLLYTSFAQMLLHVADDSVVGIIPAAGLGQEAGRTYWQGVGKISSV